MPELFVSGVPGRKGEWLVLDYGGGKFLPLAKFRDENSIRKFQDWAEEHGIVWKDERNAAEEEDRPAGSVDHGEAEEEGQRPDAEDAAAARQGHRG